MRPFPEKTGSLSVPVRGTGDPQRVLYALGLWCLGAILPVRPAAQL